LRDDADHGAGDRRGLGLARPHLDAWLVTADLPRALSFWTDVVRLDVIEARPHEATLAVGGQRLRLAAPEPCPPRASGGLYAGTGYRVLSLVVDDLEALCDRIAARGRRVAPGIDLPGRWPIRFARDADGNMIELIGRPASARAEEVDRLQVGLTVADAARMRGFYARTLGLPEQPARPMGDGMTRYAFSVGHSTLKLWERPGPLPRLTGRPGDAVGIRAVVLTTADAGEASRLLDARGRRVHDPGLPAPDDLAWVQDPEGGWLAVAPPTFGDAG
jgi:catechol 2,3-dioxygenase-like lactoylglutathione lyase family enzyme